MDTLVLRLKGKCNDPNLLKANEVILPVVFETGATAIPVCQFNINRPAGVSLEITGPAKFYTNFAGTTGATQTIEDVSTFGNIYFKPDRVASDDEIKIKITNPSLITSLGKGEDWNPSNKVFAPETYNDTVHYYLMLKSSALTFFPNLDKISQQSVFVLENESDMDVLSNLRIFITTSTVSVGEEATFDILKFGKLMNYRPGSLWTKLGTTQALLRGDLANLKGTVMNWETSSPSGFPLSQRFQFTGGTSADDAPVLSNVNFFNLNNCVFDTDQLDNLIIAINNKLTRTTKSGAMFFSGTRTSKSDAAVIALKAKTNLYINGVLQS
jgi:hypothetical protein